MPTFSVLFLNFPITLAATYLLGIHDKLLCYGLFLPFLFALCITTKAALCLISILVMNILSILNILLDEL